MCDTICIDVCFTGIDLENDMITQVNGVSLPSNLHVMQFLMQYPAYQLLTDHNGNKQIVITKTEQVEYSLKTLFTTVSNSEFVGGRPPRPVAK